MVREDLAREEVPAAGDPEREALLKELEQGLLRDAARVVAAAKKGAHAVEFLQRALDPATNDTAAEWQSAAGLLSGIVTGGAPTKWAVWLACARSVLGDFGGAEAAAGAALQWLEASDRATMRTPFLRGQPKTLALTIGASAALERGRLDKSIKFVQAGLRHDPDSAPLKTQYDGLKLLKRKTEAVDKQLKKGYSIKALDALDEAVGALDSLSHELEGSTLDTYRATLMLRGCNANSKVKRHEVAFANCDVAVDHLDDVPAGVDETRRDETRREAPTVRGSQNGRAREALSLSRVSDHLSSRSLESTRGP